MSEPISKKITYSVVLAHALFLGIIFLGVGISPAKQKHKPLIVKTIIPKTTVATAQTVKTGSVATAKPAATKPKPPAPKPKPAPKKQEVAAKKPLPAQKKEAAIADKKLQKSSKPLAPKEKKPDNRAKISDQLKKDLAESIAKIEGKKQSAPTTQQPRSQTLAPIHLQIDTPSDTDFDTDYPNLMIGYLHQSLHLPEFGEVKIQLTLHQDGHVAKLVVLNAESDKNKRYLEGNLSHLRFPSFSGSLAQKKEHTFILTFCNEI